MADGYVHTVYKNGSWINEIEGGSAVPGTHPSKADAMAAGRLEAIQRKAEHVIHNQDGSIAERNSYGNDPAHRTG